MDKQEIIRKIKSTDGLSQDEISYLIELVNTKKRYGLVWENKIEEVEELLLQNLPVLKEVKEKVILNDEENPNHILIEGDNLHALTALTFTHENKIDVIYIDPPYNTGNKDFKYNDSYVDKEDSFRHSKWLSFINKRLQIAKRLLSDDGVIFISIDDYEVAQLKLLCNEVFGDTNFVGQWNWFKSATPPNLSLKIKKNVEYVLGYEKNRTNIKYKGIKKTSKSTDPIVNKTNPIAILEFPVGSVLFSIKNGKIKSGKYKAKSYTYEYLDEVEVVDFYNINSFRVKSNFRWNQNGLINQLGNETKIFASKTNVISQKKAEYSEEAPPNLIDESVEVDTTEEAGKYLFEIFGEKLFDYPKPTSLIKYLLAFKENTTILDFFAGSGTTLDATMQLNSEDGGKRQCILVTNNENNICEEVTYERNKRVIKGYTNSKDQFIQGLTNNNLRYYKTAFVPSQKSETNKRLLTQSSTDLLCIKEDCYSDITQVNGFNSNQCRIFTNGIGKNLIIVYHSRAQLQVCEQLVEYIKTLDNLTENVKLYGFSPEKETLTEDFNEVADKIDAVPLPDAIYNAYRATFRAIKLDKKTKVSKESDAQKM